MYQIGPTIVGCFKQGRFLLLPSVLSMQSRVEYSGKRVSRHGMSTFVKYNAKFFRPSTLASTMPNLGFRKRAAISWSKPRKARVQLLKMGKVVPDIHNYVTTRLLGKPKTREMRRYLWFIKKHRNFAPLLLNQLKPTVRLRRTASVPTDVFPPMTLPEVAFIGRSNAGKSTLVNSLCGRDQKIGVGRYPGTTKELRFYDIGSPPCLRLVDTPGFGETNVPEETREQWTELTLNYLKTRKNLKRVFLLVDAYLGLHRLDFLLLNVLAKYKVSWQLIATKADTVDTRHLCKFLYLMREESRVIQGCAGRVIPVSASAYLGLEDLRQSFDALGVDLNTALAIMKDKRSYEKKTEKKREAAQSSTLLGSKKDSDSSLQNNEGDGTADFTSDSIQLVDMWKDRKDKNNNVSMNGSPSANSLSEDTLLWERTTPIENIPKWQEDEDILLQELLRQRSADDNLGNSNVDQLHRVLLSEPKYFTPASLSAPHDLQPTPKGVINETDEIHETTSPLPEGPPVKLTPEPYSLNRFAQSIRSKQKTSKMSLLRKTLLDADRAHITKRKSYKTSSNAGKRSSKENAPDGVSEARDHVLDFLLEPLKVSSTTAYGQSMFTTPTTVKERRTIKSDKTTSTKHSAATLIGLADASLVGLTGKNKRRILGRDPRDAPNTRPPQDIGSFFHLKDLREKTKRSVDWEVLRRRWKRWALRHPKQAKQATDLKQEGLVENVMRKVKTRFQTQDGVNRRTNWENPRSLARVSELPQKPSFWHAYHNPAKDRIAREAVRSSVVRWSYGQKCT